MEAELTGMENPKDNSLEQTLPEIQRKFDQLHMEVKDGNHKIMSKLGEFNAKWKENALTRGEIGELLAGVGNSLVRPPVAPEETAEDEEKDNDEENEDWQRATKYHGY